MPRYYRKRRPSRYSRRGMMRMKVLQQPLTAYRKMTYDCVKYIAPAYNIGYVPTIGFMFRANSIYDPDYAVSTAEAIGYTTAEAEYYHYTVIAARMTALWLPYSTSNTQYSRNQQEGAGVPIWIGLGLQGTNAANTVAYDNLSKDKNWNWDMTVMLPGASNHMTPVGNPTRQVKWFNAKSFFNIASPEDVDSVGAQMGANPSDQCYFCLASAVTTTGVFGTLTDFGLWSIQVHIDYWVKLGEPKETGVKP